MLAAPELDFDIYWEIHKKYGNGSLLYDFHTASIHRFDDVCLLYTHTMKENCYIPFIYDNQKIRIRCKK